MMDHLEAAVVTALIVVLVQVAGVHLTCLDDCYEISRFCIQNCASQTCANVCTDDSRKCYYKCWFKKRALLKNDIDSKELYDALQEY